MFCEASFSLCLEIVGYIQFIRNPLGKVQLLFQRLSWNRWESMSKYSVLLSVLSLNAKLGLYRKDRHDLLLIKADQEARM